MATTKYEIDSKAHDKIIRINGLAHQAEIYAEELLSGDNDMYLELHLLLAMAHMCHALSGELLTAIDEGAK